MKRVVIVGGGYAGIQLATKLDKHVDVTIVERRDAFVHNVGAIRAVVQPELANDLILPYGRLLSRGKVVKGNVLTAEASGVTLEDGTQLNADYVVLATGSGYAAPFKPQGDSTPEFKAAAESANRLLMQAQTVAIVGAGPVGVELAGEIASALPDKAVTLISNKATLFPTYRNELHDALRMRLEQLGIQLRLNAAVKLSPDLSAPFGGPIQLGSGEILQADIVFPVVGSRVTRSFASELPGSTVGASGRLKVDDWLRPSSYENIFVIGDLVDCGDAMTIAATSRQAPWLASTIRRLASGKPIESIAPYKPWSVPPIVLPLGRRVGVGVLPIGARGMIVGDWLTSMLKGKKLFLPTYRKMFGMG